MRILLTAGPTHEPIDAVRYLANRSSGAMGISLAAAAHRAGHAVTLLLGPVCEVPLPEVTTHRFQTTADLQTLLDDHFSQCDVLIMAAAVADYRPAPQTPAPQTPGSSPGEQSGDADATAPAKLPRSSEGLTLKLEATPDLVAACAARKRPDQRIIGFALEDEADLARRAQDKLMRKQLDAIVANPLQTMSSPDIHATLYTPHADPITPGPMSKKDFAAWLLSWLIS